MWQQEKKLLHWWLLVSLLLSHTENKTFIVTDLLTTKFFAIVFGLKSHNIPGLKKKKELPLWRNTSWLSFRQLSMSRHSKIKCFERQLEEQIWFVTMIPTTYTLSYLNAFQTVLQMCSVPLSVTGKCMGLADIDELKALTFRTEG